MKVACRRCKKELDEEFEVAFLVITTHARQAFCSQFCFINQVLDVVGHELTRLKGLEDARH